MSVQDTGVGHCSTGIECGLHCCGFGVERNGGAAAAAMHSEGTKKKKNIQRRESPSALNATAARVSSNATATTATGGGSNKLKTQHRTAFSTGGGTNNLKTQGGGHIRPPTRARAARLPSHSCTRSAAPDTRSSQRPSHSSTESPFQKFTHSNSRGQMGPWPQEISWGHLRYGC